MQNVAREMNLSETAFLHPRDGGYQLRWFTPAVEVDLCGHATLASAHVLWEQGRLKPTEQARFHTRSGLLTAARHSAGIELDFPATPVEPTSIPAGLVEAVGVAPCVVGKSRVDYRMEVDSEAMVRAMKPDFAELAKLPVRGLIVTARATTAGFDFVSRFFAPASGVPEDPATGFAHCSLAPYWRERFGKDEMQGYQASARGAVIGVHVVGQRVRLRGRAVTVLRGELTC